MSPGQSLGSFQIIELDVPCLIPTEMYLLASVKGRKKICLYHGWFSLTNHVTVLEVSISDIHLVGGVYLDRHLPLRLFAYMVQLCVLNCLTQNCK